MPTLISKAITGAIAAILIWALYFGFSRLVSYIKSRKIKTVELSKDDKKCNLLSSLLLIIIGIIIGIGATIICGRYILTDSTSKSEKIGTIDSISSGWTRMHKVDVFGDQTSETYLIYNFTMRLPSGIRGGALPSVMLIDESKSASYAIVISPNASNKPEEDYGLYLKLWYKEEGGSQSPSMLKFHFQNGVGYVPNLMSMGKIHEWKSEHKKVRFKGFTTDSETAQEFESSPNGIGRKGADVFLNPEFIIQF